MYNSLILFEATKYREFPFATTINLEEISIKHQDHHFVCNERRFEECEIIKIEDMELSVLSKNIKHYERTSAFTISSKHSDVCIVNANFRGYIIDNQYSFEGDIHKLYLNGESVENTGHFIEGDIFQLLGVRIVVFKEHIEIIGNDKVYKSTLNLLNSVVHKFEGFPEYTRSPRIIKRVVEDEIKIAQPPTKKEMNSKGIVYTFLPTLTMSSVTILTGVLMGRGIILIAMVMSSVVTLIMNISKFFSDKKETKLQNKKREDVYINYLLSVRKRVYYQYEQSLNALHYHNPTNEEVSEMIQNYDSRLYERSLNDEDFLQLSLGKSKDKAPFTISFEKAEVEMEADELKETAQKIVNEFSYINDKPVVIDLKTAHLGLVGEKNNIHEQLKVYFSQLTFLHSYHDLEIIFLYEEKYKADFDYLKWIPHFKIKAINTLGCIYNERLRDQVLGSVYQILKDRKLKEEENKKETRFSPHLLFVIDDASMVLNHSIMEILQKEMNSLGYSILYTTNQKAKLPENIKTIVSIENRNQAVLVMENQELKNKSIQLDHTYTTNTELDARILASIKHQEKISSQIPESIGFFELYDVDSPEKLQILERWNKNAAYKSLAAPLGVRAKDDIVMLDLHEKAHGPHGLVAGTTGSGKSEIVQSYILSLAVNFHPHEVGFLLIDYKGGGMANLFKDLPHLLGTITNLDGSESMRALVSIQSELKRRQTIFNNYEVNNINSYHKVFKANKGGEPLPHLFIISDEFAELKKEQPEFMKELVSTARIGRSLGVHLILATQKPSGVVDDQIWTNSKFKLCLKVQNEADSKEMLKTPDAANIVQPGRSYLQVGNNEIYELFQSAYSGAPFTDEVEKERTVDNRVYLVNELGQGELINEDLSSFEDTIELKKTELDVTIEQIHKVYEGLHAEEVKKPWLPSLKLKMKNPDIPNMEDIEDVSAIEQLDLNISIGLMDIPEEQKQIPYVVNLEKEGNITFVSSSGFGKSVGLANLLLNLAIKNNVQLLNYYLLDFGNSALINYKNLPHTADYITVDDTEKMAKFMKLITNEVAIRKKRLSEKAAPNYTVYNQLAEEPLKAIIVAVDNFDVAKEISDEVRDFFTKFTREGASLGLFLAISVNRFASIHFTMTNYLKVKIAGYLLDRGDYSYVVGSVKQVLPEIKGRAYVKTDGIHTIQQYIPFDFHDEVDMLTQSRAFVAEIASKNTGEEAIAIPVLPETLPYADIGKYPSYKNDIYLGLNCDDVVMEGFKFTQNPFMILGSKGSGKTNIMKVILEQILGIGNIILFDSSKMDLFEYSKMKEITYIDKTSNFDEHLQMIKEMVEKRSELLMTATRNGQNRTEVLNGLSKEFVVIHELDDYIAFVKSSPEFVNVIESAVEVQINFIVAAESSKFRGLDKLISYFKEVNNGLGLVNMGDISTGMKPGFRDKLPEFKKGFYFEDGSLRAITMIWKN